MFGTSFVSRRAALILAGLVAAAAPASALAPQKGMARPALTAFVGIERGQWAVRELDAAVAPTSICLGDPEVLTRFEHRAGACPSQVVEDGARSATVQYSCPSGGFGHSKVRVETPRLVRVDTQGVSGGRPFSYRLEARRTGAC